MYVKVADEMANCRTWSDCTFRTFRSSLIWVYIVCPDLSLRNLMINTVHVQPCLYGNGQQILRAMSSKLNSRDFGLWRFPIPTLPKVTSLDCTYEVWKYMYICRFNIESKCHVEPSLGENHYVLKEAVRIYSKPTILIVSLNRHNHTV